MSKIGKNIKKIRVVKKLSQASFAQIFNLARPSVGAYEEGRAEPKIETVIQIARYFGLSVDALLTSDLTINDLYRFDSLKIKSLEKEIRDSTRKPSGWPNVTLVSHQDSARYIQEYGKPDFIQNLPGYHLPYIKTAHAMAFEPENECFSGFFEDPDGKIMIVCELQVFDMKVLRPGKWYVIITNQNINLYRLKKTDDHLHFTCGVDEQTSIEHKPENILQAWEAHYLYTRLPGLPVNLNKRLIEIENSLQQMHEQFQLLNKTRVGKKSN